MKYNVEELKNKILHIVYKNGNEEKIKNITLFEETTDFIIFDQALYQDNFVTYNMAKINIEKFELIDEVK